MYNSVKILETDLERVYFTKHGLHFNLSGNEHIFLKLAAVIKSSFNKKKVSKSIEVCNTFVISQPTIHT